MDMHEMFLEQAKLFFDMNMDPIFLVPIAITMEEYNDIREQYFPTISFEPTE